MKKMIDIHQMGQPKNRINIISIYGWSMFPALRNQDRIIAKKVDFSAISAMEIIIFKKGTQQICHRVIKIKEKYGEKIFYTKGDFNFKSVEKVKEQDILGKVVAVYRGNKFRLLKLERTFLYYIFVNLFSSSKEALSLYIEKLYLFSSVRRFLRYFFPLKIKYAVVSRQKEEDLFKSFYNPSHFDTSHYSVFCRFLAISGEKPIGKLWLLKRKDTDDILLYGLYVKLLYRARRIGTELVKKALGTIGKKKRNVYIFLPSRDKQLLRFFKGFGFNKFLFNKSFISL